MKAYLLPFFLFSSLILLNTACLKEHNDLVPDLEGVPAGGLKDVSTNSVEDDLAELEIQLFVVDHLGGFIQNLELDNFSVESHNSNQELSILSLSEEEAEELGPFSASLLFDQSGSIRSTDPGNARIEAGLSFAEIVDKGDEASVSAFTSGGRYTFPFEILADFTESPDPLKAAIKSLAGKAEGGTPLYRSIFDLIPYTVDNSKNDNLAIIAFTDGDDTQGGVQVSDLIQKAVDNGVGIYTVGLGSNVDQDVLSQIAFQTDGAVMLAQDALQLISLYSSLGDLLHGEAKYYRLKIQARNTRSSFSSRERIDGTVRLKLSESNTINYPFRAWIP